MRVLLTALVALGLAGGARACEPFAFAPVQSYGYQQSFMQQSFVQPTFVQPAYGFQQSFAFRQSFARPAFVGAFAFHSPVVEVRQRGLFGRRLSVRLFP